MVQFTFLALASALAVVADAAAPVATKTIKLGNRQLRRGDPGTEALLKKARPYNKKTAGKAAKVAPRRRLDGDDDGFEIDGSYSLQFSECLDIKTYDEDLFDEDIVDYVQAGQVVSAKSYVLFHVCTDDTCYLDAEDDLYLVDLPTYLTNVATYHANKRNDYCEQCEEFEDTCNPEEEEEEEEEEEDEEEEDEEDEDEDEEDDEDEDEEDEDEDEDEDRKRKLAKTNQRKLKRKKAKRQASAAITRKLANNQEYIDCDQCAAYECYVDEEDMDDGQQRQDELDEEVSEWIQGLAECQETGQQWNGLDLYTGVMCSPYGDGVELAVFANEDCTWYTNQAGFQDVYDPDAGDDDAANNINYIMYAEEFIKAAFSEVTPCIQKEYADPNEDADEEDEEEDEDEEQEYQVNDYCQAIMEEDVVSINNCEADEEEEEENDDGDDGNNYDWYTYDMKEADDVEQVCATVNALDAADYSHVYDEAASGTWYKRNKKGAIVYKTDEKKGLSGGAIAGIVAIVVGVVGAGAFYAKTKGGKQAETDYSGGEMS